LNYVTKPSPSLREQRGGRKGVSTCDPEAERGTQGGIIYHYPIIFIQQYNEKNLFPRNHQRNAFTNLRFSPF